MNDMNVVLFDNPQERLNLLPLTFTRPMADLRVGISTIREKWQMLLGCDSSTTITADYLSEKFPAEMSGDDNLFIAGNVVPDRELADAVKGLHIGQALVDASDRLIAVAGSYDSFTAGDWSIVRFDSKAPVSYTQLTLPTNREV